MTTYNCATDPLTILPGENRDLYGLTKTCPNAVKVSGPGDTSVFAPGSTAEGYMTRFTPSMVEVHDDGSGIPIKDRERIFDPFFTTKAPGFGTGLGLAVVQRTVHQSGGVVWVETAREGGAAFKVFLPAAGSLTAGGAGVAGGAGEGTT